MLQETSPPSILYKDRFDIQWFQGQLFKVLRGSYAPAVTETNTSSTSVTGDPSKRAGFCQGFVLNTLGSRHLEPESIRFERDVAITIGSENPDPMALEPLKRAWVRVTVAVPPADRDHGDLRFRAVEKGIACCRPATVMADFEKVNVGHIVQNDLLDRQTGITHQEHLDTAKIEEEDNRGVIEIRGSGHLVGSGRENGEGQLAESVATPCPGEVNGDAPFLKLLLPTPVDRGLMGSVCGQHSFHFVSIENVHESGDVIRVRVGENDELERVVEERHGVAELFEDPTVWSAVHENVLPTGCLDKNSIALADVEERDRELGFISNTEEPKRKEDDKNDEAEKNESKRETFSSSPRDRPK